MHISLLPNFLLSISSVSAQLIGHSVPAANYFVNQGSGSDSNSGRTPGSAFATCTQAFAVATTGQMVAISGGGSVTGLQNNHREQCTVPAASMAVVGWSGRPTLDASDSISSGAWSATAGHPNVYQATVTTDNLSGTGFLRAWENGARLTMPASLTALESTVGYFVTDNGSLSGTSQTLYIHPTGDTNPSVNGRIYEYNHRTYGLVSNFANTTAAHLITRRNYGNNGSFEVGQRSFISDVEARDGTKHNLLVHQGTTIQDSSIKEAYYADQSVILLVYNDDTPTGNGLTFRNVSVSMSTSDLVSAISGHYNLGGTFGPCVFADVTVAGTQGGIAGGACDSTTITGYTATNVQEGVTVYSPTTISASTITGSSHAVSNPGVPTSLTITGSTLSGDVQNQGIVRVIGGSSTVSISSTTLTNTGTGSLGVEITGAGNSLTMSGNTFVFTPVAANAYMLSAGYSTYLSNYNTFPFGSTGSTNISGAWKTWAQTRSEFGQEINSTP